MYDYLNIGSSPNEENCIQVGQPFARDECKLFAKQIEKHYPPPFGGSVRVKGFDHDFGMYYEACCFYDTNNDEAERWALDVEADINKVLEFWDEEFRPNFKEETNA